MNVSATRARPIARARLSEAAIDYLARDIISARLPVGAVVKSEPELVAAYGVSKVVVRESILSLQSLGLVTVQQGKRTVVRDERDWDVLSSTIQAAFRAEGRGPELVAQLYEARLILEPAAAALAAERVTPEEISELDQLSEKLVAIATGPRDLSEFLLVDRAFHDIVARSGGNVVLRAMMRDLHRYMSFNWEDSNIRQSELPILAGHHRRIADAISRRDPGEAHASMLEHIGWASRIETERYS